jgi:hypothetical protein
MGFFDLILYSTKERYLTEEQIRKAVSEVAIPTLQGAEERLVEEAVIARRGGDGKISLQQIYRILRDFELKNKISKYDRKNLMNRFQAVLK